ENGAAKAPYGFRLSPAGTHRLKPGLLDGLSGSVLIGGTIVAIPHDDRSKPAYSGGENDGIN
ncbi:MAG: hypothetical protein ACLFVO_28620, partial [Chloroflexaceae bacterium]